MTLPSRWEGIEDRVPDSLDDLHGPAEGTVELPLHLAWSGLRAYDVSDPRLRMSMYRTVITGGGRADAEIYLNAHHLAADWPLLRKGLGTSYRRAWERKLSLSWEAPS